MQKGVLGVNAFDLTIIVPVYNEEESLPRFKLEMDNFLQASTLKSRVLFVDDGSTDGSLEIIKVFTSGNGLYGFISLNKNAGLSTAIKAGIEQVFTPYVGYIDSDLQTSPSDFLKYFEFLDEYAVVNGIRVSRQDGLIKRLSSKIANAFRRFVINDGIADTCCPLKIIDTVYAKRIPFFKGMHRFIPALVQLQGGKVKQVEVNHFERQAGTAKYRLLNRLIGPFIDTLAFVWIRKRYIIFSIKERFQTERERISSGL